MKLRIKGADLDTAAKWAAKLAPANPPTPVMAGARLVVADGQLTVSATDNNTFGSLSVPADVTTDGEIIVSAKLLHTIVGTIPNTKDVNLERSDRGLSVRCGTRWSLPELPGADTWASFPDLGDRIGEIPAETLSQAVSRVLPAVSAAPPHEIMGVSCETGETLTLAATDRYRLAVAEVEWKRAPGMGNQKLILPADLLGTMMHAANGGRDTVEIYSDGGMVGLVSPPYRLHGRLIDGKYLKWRTIFTGPEDNAVTTVAVDVAALSLAVTQAGVLAKTGFDLLRLAMTPSGIEVSLYADDTDAENSDVESQHWAGESITVGVTPRRLLDALACLGSPMVVMTFTGTARQPFMLRPADKEGKVIADGYGHLLVTRSLPDSGTAS